MRMRQRALPQEGASLPSSWFTGSQRVLGCLSASVVLAAGAAFGTVSPAWADTSPTLLVSATAPDKVSTDDDRDRTFASFIFQGVATDGGGAAAAAADLTVNLDPSPEMQVAAENGGEAIGFGLARTKTDAQGRFSFRIPALKNVESYLDSRGAIRLWILGGNNQVVVSHRFEVIPPKTVKAKAVAAFADDTVNATETDAAKQTAKIAQTEAAARSAADTDQATTDEPDLPMSVEGTEGAESSASEQIDRADAGLDSEELATAELDSVTIPAHQTAAGEPTANATAAGDNPGSACARSYPRKEYTGQYKFKQEGAPKRSWIGVQTVHTRVKTTLEYEWSNTNETRLSVGVDAAYRGVKFKAAKEKVSVAESGVKFTVAKNMRKQLEVEWDIREYRLYCHYRDSGWTIAFYTEFRPYTFTSGNRKVNSAAADIGCTTRVQIADDTWVSRTTTHGDAVSVSGFSLALDASQKNTTKHKKTFKTSVEARLCGQGGYPNRVDKVKEVA